MNALRQIIDQKGHDLHIHLPDEFTDQELEVIVFPLKSQDKIGIESKNNRLNRLFKRTKGVLPTNYSFDRNESHER